MGVSILYDLTGSGKACMFDDTTDWAFGPVADGCEVCGAEAGVLLDDFMTWLHRKHEVRDIRRITENGLFHLWASFMELHNEHECRDCEGTGRVPHGPDEVTCGACGGAGRLGGKTVEDEAVEQATGEVIR